MFQLQLLFCSIVTNGTRCSSAETQVCHRSYIIAARVHLLLPKTESLGRWGLYSTIRDLRWEAHYVYSWRKKEKRYQKDWYQEKKKSERLIKKKLMQPLSIEPVTSLDKCRVASIHQPIRNQEKEPIRTGVTSFTSAFQLYIYWENRHWYSGFFWQTNTMQREHHQALTKNYVLLVN